MANHERRIESAGAKAKIEGAAKARPQRAAPTEQEDSDSIGKVIKWEGLAVAINGDSIAFTGLRSNRHCC